MSITTEILMVIGIFLGALAIFLLLFKVERAIDMLIKRVKNKFSDNKKEVIV